MTHWGEMSIYSSWLCWSMQDIHISDWLDHTRRHATWLSCWLWFPQKAHHYVIKQHQKLPNHLYAHHDVISVMKKIWYGHWIHLTPSCLAFSLRQIIARIAEDQGGELCVNWIIKGNVLWLDTPGFWIVPNPTLMSLKSNCIITSDTTTQKYFLISAYVL